MELSRFFIIFIIFSLLFTSISMAEEETSLKKTAVFEGGSLYKSGELNILELNGNYRQMGKQYGYLLKSEFHDFYYMAVESFLIGEKGMDRKFLKEFSLSQFILYPERIKNIVYGIAETSGLKLHQVIILEQLITLTEMGKYLPACSTMSAWGEYTNYSPLVTGRNFDWYEEYKEMAKFLTVVVYNPDDGSVPVANIGYMGQVQVFTGINREGLFLSVNDGSISGGNIIRNDRTPSFILFFTFLLDNTTLAGLDSSVKSSLIYYPTILNVSDSQKAVSYEWATFDIKTRDGKEGILIATNHFLHPLWNMFPPDPSKGTVERYNNLEALSKNHKRTFNAAKMMEIFDIPLNKGGVKKSNTIYQVVATPEDLRIWLQVPDFLNWTEIDLKVLFNEKEEDFMINSN